MSYACDLELVTHKQKHVCGQNYCLRYIQTSRLNFVMIMQY